MVYFGAGNPLSPFRRGNDSRSARGCARRMCLGFFRDIPYTYIEQSRIYVSRRQCVSPVDWRNARVYTRRTCAPAACGSLARDVERAARTEALGLPAGRMTGKVGRGGKGRGRGEVTSAAPRGWRGSPVGGRGCENDAYRYLRNDC